MNDPLPYSNSSENVNLRTIDLRLTSVKEAMQRTRFVFIVMTIASSAILFTLWNNRFSRDKDYAFASDSYTKTEVVSNRPEPIHVYGRKELVSEWYKNRIIQIGLLGIRLSVSDLSLIGSLTLVVITIWFFYSQRRENEALVTLLRDVHTANKGKAGLAIRELVYQGIKDSLVFIRTGESDDPLVGLEEKPKEVSAPERPTKNSQADQPAIDDHNTFSDRVLRFLSFLPFWTIMAIMVHDLSALLMHSPPSGSPKILGRILLEQLKWTSPREFLMSAYPIFLVFVFESVALGCAIYTKRLCSRSRAFGDGSRKALKDFEVALNQDKTA